MNKRQCKKNIKRLAEQEAEMMQQFQREMARFKVDYLLAKDQDPWEARSIRHDLGVYTMFDKLERKEKLRRKQARARAWRHRRGEKAC